MAQVTVTEVSVRAEIVIRRDASGSTRIILHGQSLDDQGRVVRETQTIDITDDVPAGTRTGAENLMTNIETRLKTQWSIP